LVGDRITIAQAAAAFEVTERAIYKAIEALRIPYVKAFGVRYMRPSDMRRALVGDADLARHGRRGRPQRAG
jgi:hypothetical protein